jgi:mannose-1-phosphate guanylyltransferase/mannose-6-phosphate isomerase
MIKFFGELAKMYQESHTEHRPWGSFTVLEDAGDCKVKRLTVKPGGILSLQRHQHRSEHWTVVGGEATVRVHDEITVMRPGEHVYIPQGALHRLENQGDQDVHIIEVQVGTYFGEDDIERLEDVYGRA